MRSEAQSGWRWEWGKLGMFPLDEGVGLATGRGPAFILSSHVRTPGAMLRGDWRAVGGMIYVMYVIHM